MRLVLVACFLSFLSSRSIAMDEPKKVPEPTTVRVLDVKVAGTAPGRFGDPTVYQSG